MALTINTKTYSPFRTQADSNQFAGPANTVSVKDTLTLRRQFPKVTKDSAGVCRPGFKVVKTLTLKDGSQKDMILDVSGSVPAGAVSADILAVLSDGAAFAASQDAQDLFAKLDITG